MGCGGDEAGKNPEVVWSELGPELWEARLVESTGLTVYAGYMARTDGADPWRGYIGVDFAFIASGERAEVRRALEETARAIWATQRHAIIRTPTGTDATDTPARPDEDGPH